MNEVYELKATIKGRVQGVGFRFYVERTALRYDVSGYVRNTENGSVEVVVQGTKEILEAFFTETKQGPPAAMVKSIDVTWNKIDKPLYNFFSITY